jgi:phosphotransferase system HPr-like phosphotransfer protein
MEYQRYACDISFAEKVRIFSHDYLKCCLYIHNFDSPRYLFTKKLFSTLVSTSHVLEDFLDFHGAKNNKNWYFFRELTSAVRHLSLGGYSQTHISNRLIFYNLKDAEEFESEGTENLFFLRKTLMKLSPVIIHEAKRLNIQLPTETWEPDQFPGVSTSERLAYDIDDRDMDLQKKNIIKIASELIDIASKFDRLGFYEPYKMEEILSIVPGKVNEVEIRQFEMQVHNLQSTFDTYVIHGGYLYGNRKLKELRGYFSVVFHLLQMIGRLLHFYERHLHDAGYKNIYKQVQERLATLVDPETLMDRTINYGLYYACHFLNCGKSLAREILNENIERGAITVSIPMKLGFHSRPSLLVAKIVQHYGGQVELCVGKDRFDASSVLDIQWAGGKINKENVLEVVFEGDTRALADIKTLSEVNYGEDTMGKGVPLPNELQYLK